MIAPGRSLSNASSGGMNVIVALKYFLSSSSGSVGFGERVSGTGVGGATGGSVGVGLSFSIVVYTSSPSLK